jgi:hypothetical protein
VDAPRALADLVEISPQIEAAVVSVGVADARASVLAGAVRELLDGAGAFRSDGGRVTQLHAALADRDVFAVTGTDGRTIVAVASGRPAPGLVFYDLKRCVAAVADEI